MQTIQNIVARITALSSDGKALVINWAIHFPVPDLLMAVERGNVPATRKITLQLTEFKASFCEISRKPTAIEAKVVLIK